MMRMTIYFAAIIAFVSITPVLAETSATTNEPNTPVTLKQYLQQAALNNAGLKAAFENFKSAAEQIPQARSLPDPKLTYSYFITEVETRVGPQQHKLGIMQTFPWFGEIEARTDAAAAQAQAARKIYEATKLKLFFETKDAFYEYAFLSRAIAIAKENLNLIQHFEQVARTKYATATAGHPDVVRSQIELAQLDDKVKSLEQLRKPHSARLDAVLNRKRDNIPPWPQNIEHHTINIDQNKLKEILLQNNPELSALDLQAQSAKSKVKLANKKSYPDLGVGLDWIDTGERSGVRDSGTDPIVLMFSMNLPIWRKNYKAAQLQAQANLRKITSKRVQAQNNLLARSQQALYDFDDSARKIKLYKNVLTPKAEQLLAVSESAYRAGSIDFLSLIDAQRTLLAYQLTYERALTDNSQKLGLLEMLAGSTLSTTVEN
ncbi:MAG: TolC family protein [Planctomycetota bacterium]|jgi:outer membrane protein TolC